MPSADFWLLTPPVAMQGAAGVVMRRCLFCGSFEDSYPSTANGHAGFLVISKRVSAKSRYDRVNPFRISLISFLPHGKQISPDKDVNFPCTTACLCVSARRQAAFTLPPEPSGFVVLCQLAQELSLVCPALWRDPSARTFALRLLDASLRESRYDLRTVGHPSALAFGLYFW